MSRGSTLWIFASREVGRRRVDSALVGAVLGVNAFVFGAVLLLGQAVESSGRAVLATGPSVVVRRVDPAGGFRPVPVEPAVEQLGGVPGVTSVRPRLWGMVPSSEGSFVVVGLDPVLEGRLADLGIEPPGPGQAVVGPGVLGPEPAPVRSVSLATGAGDEMSFEVIARIDPRRGGAVHGTVFLPEEDARALLGVPPGHASDLGVNVFHDAEQQAILAALSEALDFPVQVTTRTRALGLFVMDVTRRGGLAMLAGFPAAVALVILIAAAARRQLGRRREIGRLKVMGWTTGDLVRFQLASNLIVGIPGVTLGLLAASLLVFWPGVTWPSEILLGLPDRPPALALDATGALVASVEVAALVVIPWLTATLWPAFRLAATDPEALLQEGRR